MTCGCVTLILETRDEEEYPTGYGTVYSPDSHSLYL